MAFKCRSSSVEQFSNAVWTVLKCCLNGSQMLLERFSNIVRTVPKRCSNGAETPFEFKTASRNIRTPFKMVFERCLNSSLKCSNGFAKRTSVIVMPKNDKTLVCIIDVFGLRHWWQMFARLSACAINQAGLSYTIYCSRCHVIMWLIFILF